MLEFLSSTVNRVYIPFMLMVELRILCWLMKAIVCNAAIKMLGMFEVKKRINLIFLMVLVAIL